MKSIPVLCFFSVMFIFLPFFLLSALEPLANIQVVEEDDFVSRPIEEIEELFRQKEFDIVIDECKRLAAYDPWRWEAKWALMKLSEVYESIGDVGQAQAIRERLKAQTSHPRERAEIMLWQLRHMVDVLEGRTEHRIPPLNSLKQMRVMDAVLESIRSGEVVNLDLEED